MFFQTFLFTFLFSSLAHASFLVQDGSLGINKMSNQNMAARELKNCTIATSVGSSALTIALKDYTGADPSAKNPCLAAFRSTTASDGSLSYVKATAATSVVVSSGSTLGCTSAVDCYLYVYLINNSGSVVLGVMNGFLDDNFVQSSTAEGGAGAADSANVLYTTSAVTSKAVRLLARVRIQEATAGTWASNATDISSQGSSYQTPSVFWQGYHDSTCSFARTNTSYGDPAADSSCAFTTVSSRNFPTVSSHTSGGNKLPGISFTTVLAGTYRICANANVYGASAGHKSVIRLVDGSGTFYSDSGMSAPGNQYVINCSVCALAYLTSGQAVTFKIESKNDSGAVTIGDSSGGNTTVDWTVVREGQ